MAEPTHILLMYPTKKTEMLFRASDGICLGQHDQNTVIFGDRPNKRDSHVFMNEELAAKFLRETVTARDLAANGPLFPAGAEAVVIEERNAESTIIVPANASSLDLPGGINSFRN